MSKDGVAADEGGQICQNFLGAGCGHKLHLGKFYPEGVSFSQDFFEGATSND